MFKDFKRLSILLLAGAAMAACSKGGASASSQPAPPPAPPQPAPAQPAVLQPPVQPAPKQSAPPPAPSAPGATAINNASFNPPATGPVTPPDKDAPPDPMLIKAEVLLDRANFSPGVIDGKPGTNFKHALTAYQTANSLPKSGDLDQATWDALTKGAKPVATSYTITPQDEAGPFSPDVGEDFVKLAALPEGPAYHNAQEMLAERFHMGRATLATLNPGVDFNKAGSVIVVAEQPGAPQLDKGEVKRIEVSKAHAEVTAFGEGDKVLAIYPATVGSRERPSPSGTHKVDGVAWNTDYTYDPSKLHWGPRSHGKLHIKPGPNGPVGVVWIALNAPDYGIHGTPDPSLIGKTASHGCVRLTNWDATALAHGVHPGTVVQFVGTRGG